MGGQSFLKRIGLGRVSPCWLGNREDLITVGGLKSKSDECWRDTKKDIHDAEKVRIIAYMLESLINVVMSTHIYKFGGQYFLQSEGGPIGLRSTASLASLVMKIWDLCWRQLLDEENIDLISYMRYVDDARNFARPLAEGWRWSGLNGRFEFSKKHEEEDILSGKLTRQGLPASLCLRCRRCVSLSSLKERRGECSTMVGYQLLIWKFG